MVVRRDLTPLEGSGGNRRRLLSESRSYRSYMIIFALFATQITMLFADEESDFDFVDKQHLEGIKVGDILSSQAILDDEDLMNDQGSATSDPENSGTTEIVTSTQFSSRIPVFSSTTAVTSDPPRPLEQYRSVINFTSLRYSAALNNTFSAEYSLQSRSIAAEVESVFRQLDGQQKATVVQFRPGSSSPGVAPSTLVTVDLETRGFSDRLTVFNVLNNAINRRALGAYTVSPLGFEFRSLSRPENDPICPSTIGRPPTSMPHLGDSHANLMRGNTFVCSGWLERVEYFRGVSQYTAFLGVWFERGRREYVLRAQVELPPAPIGIHTVDFPPVRVEAGDFLGVHYASGVRSGVIGYATPQDNVIPVEEMYQVMVIDIHSNSITPHKSLHYGGEKEYVKKAFALQGFLRADGVSPGATTTSPVRPSCVPFHQFQCSNGACIDIQRKCDGQFDCTDQSDEFNCVTEPPSCRSDEHRCDNGQCIDKRRYCDGRVDCADRSDEGSRCPSIPATCSSTEFECNDGECIDNRRVCDNYEDCRDGSDEDQRTCRTEEKTCEWWQFKCKDGECIDNRLVCNNYPDCRDRSDESDCDHPAVTTTPTTTTTERVHRVCHPPQFRCSDDRCIEESQKCDGRADCPEEEDEDERVCDEVCPAVTPPVGTSVEKRGRDAVIRCLENGEAWSLTCSNGKWVGETGSCTPRDGIPRLCSSTDFQCRDGTCISAESRCNRSYECYDSSDEVDCSYTSPRPVQCTHEEFRCADGSCIDRRRLCDGHSDCSDRADERNCYTPPPSRLCAHWEFRCSDGSCIDPALRCNRRYDCPNGEDEALCEPVTLSATPSELRILEGRTASFFCRSQQGSSEVRVRWSRGRQGLPAHAVDDGSGRLTISDVRLSDSGDYTCSVADLQEAEVARVVLNVDRATGPTQAPPGPRQCYSADEFMCNNKNCVPSDYRCDGDYDCADRSDEANCRNEAVSCEPNEFKCTTNNKCILKIWVCDGDDDCGGDGSDEVGCDAQPPRLGCRSDEFQCRTTGQCIPSGYQCDLEPDCTDRSDESGCIPPSVVKAPPPEVMVHEGGHLMIDCEAIGIPPPLIVWRLNWGHIGQPPRVSSKYERIDESHDRPTKGRGVLTIDSARKEDEGAYTCEALNSMGSIFVEPDTIVHVLAPEGLCTRGYFNSDARSRSECVRCFCFGLTDDCTSSSLFLSEISIGNTLEIVDRYNQRPLERQVFRYDAHSREFSIYDYSRTVRGSNYYWSLPRQFLGNKVTSYGGKLSFSVSYNIPHGRRSYLESGPDIILSGNGITLYHSIFTQPFAGTEQKATIKFSEDSWTLDEQGYRKATRENLMTALQKLDYIMIKSSYDREQTDVRLSEVSMTVTTPHSTHLGKAFLVEQCSCPVGYTGTSCEQCAPGFRLSEERGQYIGRCLGCDCNGHSNECDIRTGLCKNCQHNTEGDRCDRCKPGYYMNPRLGASQACQPCPCPPSDGPEPRASECYLDNDGQVSCRACPAGYQGRRCDSCAPGYQSRPGGSCQPLGQHCDPKGSLSLTPDPYTGECQCKQLAAGPTCSQCRENSFYPAEVNPNGCVACFCMGVTSSCTSTSWNRAQVTVSFQSDTQGFTLTDRNRHETITDGIIVDRQKQEIRFRNFHELAQDDYYWSLPAKFLRNKVASYGGNLRFTIQHLPGLNTRPTEYPVVEISGNDIVLQYLGDGSIRPNSPTVVTVPLYETFWRRSDGKMATREFLMMALADLNFIMIKAKYTKDVAESSIKDVVLDVAESRNTGQGRAFPVEECVCPPGYRGLSCEICDTGYRRSGGGLYLGTCEPCDCFGHSSDCDSATGMCANCQHNTAGDRCDVCAPGFYGNAMQGTRNDCLPCPCPLTSAPNQFSQECYLDEDDESVTCSNCPPGHVGRRCESCAPGYHGNPFVPGDYCRRSNGGGDKDCRCDTRGVVPNTRCDSRTGQCTCKDFATGSNCDQCKPGYFNLAQANPDGCLSCFCSGVGRQCTSSRRYRSQITPVFQGDGSHNFALTDKRLSQQITDGFRVNAPANEISFDRFHGVQRQGESLYWNLPPRFRGNQVASYGGKLKFLLSYSTDSHRGRAYQDTDVEFISGDQRLYTNFRSSSEAPTRHEIQLVESSFRQLDRSAPTRATFLGALAKLDAVLIRATYHTSMQRSVLSELSMDTAVPYNTGQEVASMVEDCTCPSGYTGLSCEECASGYSHVNTPGRLTGSCVACSCNGHSTSCDQTTGACRNCQHNTVGDRCDRCAPGYYGEARTGTPHDCRQCPCPLTIPENQFSRTCRLDSDGGPTCDACAPGYIGRQCDQCAPGYTGNPRQPGGSCTRESEDNKPQISISPTRISSSAGGSVTFQCDVRGHGPFNVQWMRADGRPLPTDRAVTERDYSLRITNLRTTDSGRYICVAVNAFGRSQLDAELNVLDDRHLQVIVNEPKEQTVAEGSYVEFHCIGISQNVYTLAWTRKDGRPMETRVMDDGQGKLSIRGLRREDQGAYICTGSDFYNVATDEAVLTIKAQDQAPQVRISPHHVTARMGERVELRCVATGYPTPRIEWSGRSGSALPTDVVVENDILRFRAVTSHHAGEYQCRATNQAGRAITQAVLEVQDEVPGLEVIIDQPELKVGVGEEAKVDCTARSHIEVEGIEWSKYGDRLPPGAYQVGGQLIIPECKPEYSGRYVCTIYLVSGERKVAYSTITITDQGLSGRAEAPTVTMNPERQIAYEGSRAEIYCEVTGNPSPSISWSRARGPLGRNHQVLGNVLRIMDISLENGDTYDTYICEATNSAGSARGTAVIQIEREELPAVEIYPNSVIDVHVGENALFQCLKTSSATESTLTWTRANNEPFTSNTEVTEGSGAIRFFQVTGAEQGSYICTATTRHRTVSATATLRIQGALSVVMKPSGPLRLFATQRLFIECVVRGDQHARVYLETPQNKSIYGTGVVHLDIPSASASDSGAYRCVARSHSGGQAAGVLQVTVTDFDETHPTRSPNGRHVTADVQPQQIRVALGQTAEFRCSATGAPRPHLQWTKVDGNLPHTHYVHNGVLRIERVSESDSGTYKCLATTPVGRGEVTVELHVLIPPQITISPAMQTLRPGDQFRIQCNTVRGTEPIVVEWSKLYGSLSPYAVHSHNVLGIAAVTPADSGRYRCSASNEAGRAESFAELIILASPGAIVSPKSIHMGAGQTAEFNCHVTGSPHPRIQWLKDRGALPEQHSVEAGRLILFNVQPHDEGQYFCVVTNEAGTTRDHGELKVTGSSTGNGQIGGQREVMTVGDRVEINCEVSGEPLPVVKWIKVDGQISPHVILEGTYLTIPSITEEDQGTYRCVASSVTGTVYSQVTLIVARPPEIPVSQQTRTVSTGGRAVLTCRAVGEPLPHVQWSKRGGALPRDHETENGVLVIPTVRPEDYGDYVCTAQNEHGFAEGVITLQSGELVPYFSQNPVSYLSYPTIKDAYKSFDIDLTFKSQSADGLILYNGQHDDRTGDFISLGMRNRRVELRLDVGSGPAIVTTDTIELDAWHTVTIKRDGKDVSMFLNGREYKGQAPGSFIGLDLIENMYVGAVPDFRRISLQAGYTKGFVGCISQIVLSGVPLNLGGEVLDNIGVTDCPVCQNRPCRNGGTCRPSRSEYGYVCLCPPNYSGSNCELVGQRCTEGVCGRRGRCHNLEDGSGYRCSCPLGITGPRCDQGSPVASPSFNSSSHIAYVTLRDAQYDVRLKLTFRPNSADNSLLLYDGFSRYGDGDFIVLSIRDDYIHFQFDTGAGPADIQSREPVKIGEWTTVVAERSQRDGSLSVNNGVAVKGRSPEPERGRSQGDTVGLNLKTHLFIGGVSDVRVSPAAGILAGFSGCISELSINDVPVDLVNDAITYRHISECSSSRSRPCSNLPCQNDGTCLERGQTFLCVCSFRYKGRLCESRSQIETDASFDGNGYIELSQDHLPHDSPLSSETVEFSVTTEEENALLFWHGQPPGTPGRGKDYISVAIENGHVVYSYELGSGPANITSRDRINDGATHHIKIVRTGTQGLLELDGFDKFSGDSGGDMTSLNAGGNIYIGGVPDYRTMTGGKYSRGLIGCIADVYIDGDEPLNFSRDAVGGVNVQPC